jgi:DNA-binding SARP family transcriptional activator
MSADLPTLALRLTLLGAPQLVDASGGRSLPWQRPTALLAYLACQPDWVSRDQLATWLRPEAAEDSARAYLRRLPHRARDLGLAGGLEIEPQRVRWAAGADVRDLAVAAQARDWPRVLALYRGPLLDGAGLAGEAAIDEFFADERERCRTRWRAALCARIDDLHAAGDHAAIAPLMQRLADDDALDEDGVQFLLDRAGSEPERTVALAAFETLQRRLAYEMALRPLPATQALAQSLRDRVFAAAPAEGRVGTAAAIDDGADLTPFIGRDAEQQAVQAQLAGAVRMVTLLGPGGVGKTRLARRVLQDWSGATALVDLSDVENEAGLLTALLGGLRVPACPARPRSSSPTGSRRARCWCCSTTPRDWPPTAPHWPRWPASSPRRRSCAGSSPRASRLRWPPSTACRSAVCRPTVPTTRPPRCSAPRQSATATAPRPTMRRRSWASPARSTACRWRSNSRRNGCTR